MTQGVVAPDELSRRYRALYTGAVSDVLDGLGLRQQALPHYIMPLTLDMVVAGPAFTGQGYPVSDIKNDDSNTRIRMLESIKPGTVSVWSSAGQIAWVHWGEMCSCNQDVVEPVRGASRCPKGFALRQRGVVEMRWESPEVGGAKASQAVPACRHTERRLSCYGNSVSYA